MSERRGTKALETWCRRLTEGYPGVKVENMTTSWRDGLAFCAIIHHFRPDLIDFNSLNKSDVYYNNSLAFRIAERHLGIPALLDAEDMVEYAVPDRLSILTYLSQFYQVFGTNSAASGTATSKQASPTRLVPKRSQDRGMISPASTSPPTKMASRSSIGVTGSALVRREPCFKCGNPVFLAERLNVGTQLYHRTCFRCARCNNQLSLANYYETETDGQYCCETCPDEEGHTETDGVAKELVPPDSFMERLNQLAFKNRSLSDEEKSTDLQHSEDDDDYSANFEKLLENSKSNVDMQTRNTRLTFLKQQLSTEVKTDEVPEESSPLPVTEPPDDRNDKDQEPSSSSLAEVPSVPDSEAKISSASVTDSPVNSLELEVNQSDPIVNKSDKISDSSNQPITASDQLLDTETTNLTEINITKDTNRSLVKSQIVDSKVPSSSVEIIDTQINITDSSIITISSDQDVSSKDCITITSSEDTEQSIEDNSKYDVVNYSDSLVVDSSVSETSSPLITKKKPPLKPKPDLKQILSKSVLENLSTDQSSVSINLSQFETSSSSSKSKTEYPEDLNPFGDEEEKQEANLQNIRQVIKPSREDLTITTPESSKDKRSSMNPFGSSDDEETEAAAASLPPQPAPRDDDKKVVSAPKISLNPFWSDEDEDEEKKPVPKPRSKHLSTPEPSPRKSLLLSNVGDRYESNTSLSSMNSSVSLTSGKKKKIAPLPPTALNIAKGSSVSVSPVESKQSSPSTSSQPSPKLTPRNRKIKKAPLPPSSTPVLTSSVFSPTHSDNYSPIQETEDYLLNTKAASTSNQQDRKIVFPETDSNSKESIILSPTDSLASSEVEKEKINKDEKNRNRQSQIISSPVLSDSDSVSLSQQCSSSTDKSIHGKWKRKKGPAPARPVPERRQIRPLPLTELRRELDIIEMQQQGLEKQGVKLEHLIREKCETPGSAEDTSLSSEVEEMVLELFELVNEKNELFRRQAELMYLRRQQRLEEEYADIEYQIRCLMNRPEKNKTDSDKAREEELINRLVGVVERRNEIVECLEMDRKREAEEDHSIKTRLNEMATKREEELYVLSEKPVKLSKKEKKKVKKEKKLKDKGKTVDADKDIDESETRAVGSVSTKQKKKKKFFF